MCSDSFSDRTIAIWRNLEKKAVSAANVEIIVLFRVAACTKNYRAAEQPLTKN